MNAKRYAILSKCKNELSKITKADFEFYKMTVFDFRAISNVCQFFAIHKNDDEVFIGNKTAADWFRKIGGFSVEEESSMYHIFIEDKENEVTNL